MVDGEAIFGGRLKTEWKFGRGFSSEPTKEDIDVLLKFVLCVNREALVNLAKR